MHGSGVAIAVVAYEAEDTIADLLDRIPTEIAGAPPLILVSDDCSQDRTAELAAKWAIERPERSIQVVRQERNLGYGGNQKACYRWAQEQGADIAVLLHGDEQYPPERIPDLVQPIVSGTADAVFGSRMLDAGGARGGGMPLDRFVANVSLTRILNALQRVHLSEWFSGFRAYRLDVLAAARYAELPDGFDFDTKVIVRLLQQDARIVEVPIPTRYAEEVSRVPLVRTGLNALRHGLARPAVRPRVVPPPAIEPASE
jgi:glycosyltransferase involved in cell wall biosynthesis